MLKDTAVERQAQEPHCGAPKCDAANRSRLRLDVAADAAKRIAAKPPRNIIPAKRGMLEWMFEDIVHRPNCRRAGNARGILLETPIPGRVAQLAEQVTLNH